MMAEIDHARIKRNVSKMISLGAPEADIDAYVASENVTPEQLRKAANTPATPEDPVKAQVRGEIDTMRKQGVPVDNGLARQYLQGATFNLADEALAGLSTPLEMIKRKTWNPAEAYNYAKAREDILMEGARKNGGAAGVGMEVLGGFGTGSGLAKGGLSFMPKDPTTASLGRRIAGAVGDGMVLGAVSGAADANGTDRVGAGLTGAAVGGGVSGGLTAAAPLLSAAAAPTMGWVRGVTNPEGFAQRQVGRAVSESGRPVSALAQEIADAQASGQPFTLADALGNPGQRMLSAVTRAPGVGRTEAVNFLDARQAGQGKRIAAALAEGLDAPVSADRASAALTAQRKALGNANYGAARDAAGAVDVSPAIQQIDKTLQPGVTRLLSPQTNIADNSIESTLRRAKSLLTDGKSQLSDFDQVLLAKQEIDALIEGAKPTVQRVLIPVKQQLDDQLAKASGAYGNARDQYRAGSKVIEAIDTGKDAAMRGRTEDTIRTFNSLSPQEQKTFRVGYADPLIEDVQRGAVGANKARPFTSQAMQEELPAFTAYQGPTQPGGSNLLQQQLARENRMFETRGQAMGGSRTADNLADSEALGINPEIVGNLLSGNVGTAAKNLIFRSGNAMSGNTSKVREELAKMLLSGDTQKIESQIMQAMAKDKAFKQKLTQLLSGATAGVALPAYNANRR